MSEDEAIKYLKDIVEQDDKFLENPSRPFYRKERQAIIILQAIETLLDLHQKEKETSHFLQSKLDEANAKIIELKEEYKNEQLSELKELNNYVRKSIIKEKIKEKQSKINKMHPASDIVIIDDLENQIEVLKELLED